MFGHLKAEDFTNLLEGAPLAGNRQAHLQTCARCAETLRSVEGVRRQIAEMRGADDAGIPEPDWADFRSEVRTTLLSRSVKRENARAEWLIGFGWKPAMAWSLSLVFVFGLTAGLLLWNRSSVEAPTQVAILEDSLSEVEAMDAATAMAQADVFDELLRLDESEAESLSLLLEDLMKEGVSQQ